MPLYQNGLLPGSGISEAEKGSPDGVATLDSSGVHPDSQLSETARNRFHVVANTAARLALVVSEGHECMQTDDSSQWIYDDIVGWVQRTGGGGGIPILSGVGNPNGVTVGVLNQKYRDTSANIYYTQITDPTGWDWIWCG